MLETLITRLSKIPRLNHGGCGLAAMTIYQYLKARGENPKFVLIYEKFYFDTTNIDEIKKIIFDDWDRGTNYVMHIVVKREKPNCISYIDANLITDLHGMLESCGLNTENSVLIELEGKDELLRLKELVKKEHCWNSTFKRHLHIHEVREINPLQLTLFKAS